MTTLTDRRWAIELGLPNARGTRYEYQRMQFRVRYGEKPTAHGCTVVFSNPPATLVSSLSREGMRCRVLAGYRDGGAVELCQGTIVEGSIHDRRATGDPHVEWQVSASRAALEPIVAISLPGPVTTRAVLAEVRSQISLAADSESYGSEVTYARGYVGSGSARQIIADLADSADSRWAIVDGRLRIWPRNAPANRRADLWQAGTGLIEVASPTNKGRVRATALLRPGLRTGDLVRINGTAFSGDLEVVEVSHEGDTGGDPWYTSIVGRPVDA